MPSKTQRVLVFENHSVLIAQIRTIERNILKQVLNMRPLKCLIISLCLIVAMLGCTFALSMTFANSPIQTKQCSGVTSRKQSPLFKDETLGSTSLVWTCLRPEQKKRKEKRIDGSDFINAIVSNLRL